LFGVYTTTQENLLSLIEITIVVDKYSI
jgi:hypothetical protein